MATLKETAADALPGDMGRKELIARMIRVDHAGEYGAVRIYQGQMAILGKGDKKALLEHMVEHERQHLDTFGKLIEGGFAPRLLPLWAWPVTRAPGRRCLAKKPPWPARSPSRKPSTNITPVSRGLGR